MQVGVEVDVTLNRAALIELLEQAGPLRIHLTEADEDRRWVELEAPSEVIFVPGIGVRLVTRGRMRHELAGVGIPFGIRRLQILFTPEVVHGPHGQRLDFRLRIEEADLENVPGLVEGALIPKVNDALEPARLGLFWDVSTTLSRAVSLPERFEPLDRFATSARAAHASVTSDAIVLRLSLALALTRSKPRPTDD